MIRAVRYTLLVLIVFSAGAASSMVGRAQSASSGSPDVLTALLTEVRGLRTAIEHMAAAGPRVQLALGRLQIQEQRVAEVVRRLDSTRKSLSDTQKHLDTEGLQWKAFEDRLNDSETSQNERRELETMIKHMKAVRQGATGEIQRLQTEEAALAQDLANEQGRWSQLSQQVEELERSLGRRQP